MGYPSCCFVCLDELPKDVVASCDKATQDKGVAEQPRKFDNLAFGITSAQCLLMMFSFTSPRSHCLPYSLDGSTCKYRTAVQTGSSWWMSRRRR